MGGLSGMEKFSHLEDKIYLTIEFAKKMREEKEQIEHTVKDKIEIVEGISNGELVITSPSPLLKEGEKVDAEVL